jgi:kynurenine formamidase
VTTLSDALRSARIFDVSPPLARGIPVFPGHPQVAIDAARTHELDGYYLQTLSLGEHTGSHVDAPAHAHPHLADRTIDTYPAERFVAPYVKYDLGSYDLHAGENVSLHVLQEVEARDGISASRGAIAIVDFGWSSERRPDGPASSDRAWWIANAPGLAEDACRYLAESGVAAVGSDTATCDTSMLDGRIVSDFGHRTFFLPRDILIVEGLTGLAAAPASGVFIGLPLRIRDGSGSPIRAILLADPSG